MSVHWKRVQVLAAMIFVLVLSGCTYVAPVSEAKQISGSVKIDQGDFYGWRMDISIPSQLDVRISSQNDSVIDVLVLDQANYSTYSSQSDFGFVEAHSLLSVSNYSANMTVLSGTVYIIVDNSDRPLMPGAARSTGPVWVDYWMGSSFDLHAVPDQGNAWLVYLLAGAIALTFVLVIALTRIALKGQKKVGGSRQR